MAFSFSDYTNFQSSVRFMCARTLPEEMPDAILTAGANPFLDLIVVRVNALYPAYDSLSSDEKLGIQVAAIRLLAANMCRTVCKGNYKNATDDQQGFSRDKIDWDALASQLESAALAVLVPSESLHFSSAMLVGNFIDAATDRWDYSIIPNGSGGVSLV